MIDEPRLYWVRYGGKGRQLASDLCPYPHDRRGRPRVRVRKYRAISHRWTGPVPVLMSDVLGRARLGDQDLDRRHVRLIREARRQLFIERGREGGGR